MRGMYEEFKHTGRIFTNSKRYPVLTYADQNRRSNPFLFAKYKQRQHKLVMGQKESEKSSEELSPLTYQGQGKQLLNMKM